MRRGLAAVLLLLLLLPGLAHAHGGGLAAYATLNPPAPAPGEPAQLTLEVVDPAGNPVLGATVSVRIGAAGTPTPFVESNPGFYSGPVTFPMAGAQTIWADLELPGGKFAGQLMIEVGPGAREVRDVGFELEVSQSVSSWMAWAASALALVAGIELIMFAMRKRRPQEGH